MNPAIKSLCEYVATQLAHEVDVQALESTVLGYEWTHPFANPVPAIISNAEKIFIDPNTRPAIVNLLAHLHTKATAPLP